MTRMTGRSKLINGADDHKTIKHEFCSCFRKSVYQSTVSNRCSVLIRRFLSTSKKIVLNSFMTVKIWS